MDKLRKYQIAAVGRTLAELDRHRHVLLVLPTGAGKTTVANAICKRFNRILWIAHRHELLEQARARLRTSGVKYETLSAYAGKMPDGEFDLVVFDEYHHVAAPTFRRLLGGLRYGKLLGLTATPIRADGCPVIYDKVIFGAPVDVLTSIGFLAQPRLVTVRNTDAWPERVAHWARSHEDLLGQSIIFVPGIAFGKHLSRLIPKSELVTGESPRDLQIADYKSQKIKHLISCLVLTEGVDLPQTKSVVIARRTKSNTMISQMIGRALRPYPDKKWANVVRFSDLIPKSDPFKLVNFTEQWVSDLTSDGWVTRKLSGLLANNCDRNLVMV